MEWNATHTQHTHNAPHLAAHSRPPPQSRKPRASPPSPRACPSQDSPRSRRRLASSGARVGGKVGQREERRDERREGAQKQTRAEGREERPKGGADRPGGSREVEEAGGERREAPVPAGLRWAKRAAGRLRRRGPLGTPSQLRIRGRRDSYLARRGGFASGESAVACASGRVPASPAPARRPRALFGSWRGRESSAAGARLPAALGARRLQPGREQWSRSWCPGGGAGGGLPSAARGLQTLCPSFPDRGGGVSRSLQTGLHRSAEAPAPRRARLQHGYRALCGAPRARTGEKSSGSAAFRAAARSRPGKARSPQCATRILGPVRTWPCCRHSPGSSARCGCTGVPAPAHCRPPPRTPRLWPKERSERCAPARREGSPSHSHRRWSLLRLRPLPLPAGPCSSPAAAPEEGEPAERAELSGALPFSSCSLFSFGACAPASERVPEGAGMSGPRHSSSLGRVWGTGEETPQL
nr:translation initiation factor IF-2-like [Chlorocebus sabaeus]